ncbi:SDR family NAD(P)-dependent oxidoreductase [Phytoactinopolyspora halotolerans]|uniref:SDR family oxidoreductase n=1 Tax=Phytoactinopolyspora halotolerans TaxID=1981512 RepID=A0A6L9SGA6_9ACTN|nr:SDR family oxidoreductase [Phytoactinopolyspora halotolerans]NEE03674.1 SDR family oxidoreductase [Phytoactinopolyspora halotolerans]
MEQRTRGDASNHTDGDTIHHTGGDTSGHAGTEPSGVTIEGAADKRRVLVIGGTSGIGAAVATRFAATGADVTVAGRPAAGDADPLPPGVTTADLDLRDAGAVEQFVADRPVLDVLVNSAGVIRRDEEFRPEVFDDVLAVNLSGTMRACVAARELLVASRGCIVNVASMLSFFGGARVPGYAASKGGVVQLTKSLAVAWAADGVRVNAVAPGWIRTELTAGLRQHSEAADRIVDRTPMGRWGEPSDVAGAVMFLAGPDAAFITGVVLPVDGGYLAA